MLPIGVSSHLILMEDVADPFRVGSATVRFMNHFPEEATAIVVSSSTFGAPDC
jgi:hypothetical protein